ncbi:MAG: glycosyltransferase family 2 protein [Acidimicrobiales bacterium]
MRQMPSVAEEARAGVNSIDAPLIVDFLSRYETALHDAQIVILIPAYNEAESLRALAQRLPSTILGLRAIPILLVDGATDDTAQIGRSLGLPVCEATVNRGQGAVLKLGYQIAAQAAIPTITIVDADGQWSPNDLERIVEPLIKDRADFTQGSRVLGETHVGDPVRDIGVVVFAKIVSLVMRANVTDTSSGIRGFRTTLLESIRLEEPQYQSSELLIAALAAGARLLEIPVTLSKRHGGRSKKGNNFIYGANYARVVLKTLLREKLSPRS